MYDYYTPGFPCTTTSNMNVFCGMANGTAVLPISYALALAGSDVVTTVEPMTGCTVVTISTPSALHVCPLVKEAHAHSLWEVSLPDQHVTQALLGPLRAGGLTRGPSCRGAGAGGAHGPIQVGDQLLVIAITSSKDQQKRKAILCSPYAARNGWAREQRLTKALPLELDLFNTDYKNQGATRQEFIVSLGYREFRPPMTLQNVYTLLTRVKFGEDLRLLPSPAGFQHLAHCHHSQELRLYYDSFGDGTYFDPRLCSEAALLLEAEVEAAKQAEVEAAKAHKKPPNKPAPKRNHPPAGDAQQTHPAATGVGKRSKVCIKPVKVVLTAASRQTSTHETAPAHGPQERFVPPLVPQHQLGATLRATSRVDGLRDLCAHISSRSGASLLRWCMSHTQGTPPQALQTWDTKAGSTITVPAAIHGDGFKGNLEVIEFGERDPIGHARMRARQHKVVLLNMANATNAGGGYLSGAQAPEEELCQQSDLYLRLQLAKARHQYPILPGTALLTPEVQLSNHGAPPQGATSLVMADIVSVAAMHHQSEAQVMQTLQVAAPSLVAVWMVVITAARVSGAKELVISCLGAGECHNPPELVGVMLIVALRICAPGQSLDLISVVIPDDHPGHRGDGTLKRMKRGIQWASRSVEAFTLCNTLCGLTGGLAPSTMGPLASGYQLADVTPHQATQWVDNSCHVDATLELFSLVVAHSQMCASVLHSPVSWVLWSPLLEDTPNGPTVEAAQSLTLNLSLALNQRVQIATGEYQGPHLVACALLNHYRNMVRQSLVQCDQADLLGREHVGYRHMTMTNCWNAGESLGRFFAGDPTGNAAQPWLGVLTDSTCRCARTGLREKYKQRLHRVLTPKHGDVWTEFVVQHITPTWNPCGQCGQTSRVDTPKYPPGQAASWNRHKLAGVPPIITILVDPCDTGTANKVFTLRPGDQHFLPLPEVAPINFHLLSVLYYGAGHYIVVQNCRWFGVHTNGGLQPRTTDDWRKFDGMHGRGVGQCCDPPTGGNIGEFRVEVVTYGLSYVEATPWQVCIPFLSSTYIQAVD